MAALNPNAPEFSPAVTKNHNRYSYFLPPPIFYYSNPFPPPPFKTYQLPKKKHYKAFTNVKSRFCNRKSLPPRLLKSKIWVHKTPNSLENKLCGNTSVMVRNIPNCFRRSELLSILDTHCLKHNKEAALECDRSSYDFLYLPMDFLRHGNLGYAFVNFTSSRAAERFRREFDNLFWGNNLGNKNKVCEITIAKFQGKEELSQHFKNSRFTCHSDQYLPVVLSPPSDGFTAYKIMTLGLRVGVSRRTSSR